MAKNNVYLLIGYKNRSKEVDKVLTGIIRSMLELFAIQNRKRGYTWLGVERDTGRVFLVMNGSSNTYSKARRDEFLEYTCEDFGFNCEDIKNIKDERFDNGEE